MSVVDSEAVFRNRGVLIGVSEAVLDLFKDAGIATMGKLAFASSYVPGAADDAPFTNLVKQAIKREPTLGELSGLRRLFSESYAATAAEMRSIVEQSDETPTRRLAPAERSERFETQQKKLTGIKISGMLEPGDSLVDAAVAIYESDRMKYIEWQYCVSREHEVLTSTKKDTSLSFDSSGVLKMSTKNHIVPCEATSELQVKYCLTRRGLALEQGNVLSFANHEKWTEKLFASRLNEPPAGYARVSFKQMQLADAKLFVVLGEKCRSGIKVASGSNRPCDDKFDEAMNSTDVQHLLQPMPLAQKTRNETETVRVQPVRQTIDKKGSGKTSGKKGKGKGRVWKPSIPQELLSMGCVGMTSKGNSLCYDFQLGKCTMPVQNQKCAKGLHLCAMPGCHRDHPAKDCNSRKRD
eukprot:s3298_g5.t1